MDMLEGHLNKSQHEAVTTINGPVLVIAGAGSGKTRVIEYSSLHLVRSGVNPSSILLLTFTKRAAREMISRASRHDPRCKDIEGGTFHSFAYRMLKRYAKRIGIQQEMIILDEGDSQEAIHRCATQMNLYSKDKRFPKKDTLRNIISMSVNKGTALSETIKREYPHFIEYAEDILRLAQEYARYKISRGYIDYDDMLLYLNAMLEDEDIRAAASSRYRYVMIDEYQDTNSLQGNIAALISSDNRNIMIVGDDAQSIYGFRGATHRNIMLFPEVFPDCRIIKLEENYRSTQSILDTANALLETMENKYEKCLHSVKAEYGLKPSLIFFKSAYDEAEWIADKIKALLDEGTSLSHQSVLCRSMYLTIPLQAELSKRNIPYETFGGIRFYEMAHVKDLLSHLKVLANPRDELAWHRVLMLIEGVGVKTSEALTSSIGSAVSLESALEILSRKASSMRRPQGLMSLVNALSASVTISANDVGALFDMLLEYYKPLMKTKFDDWHIRINDLETLRQIAGRYGSLEDMLNDFALEPPERAVWAHEPETKEEERPLCISTIHSAKGLEWDVVFIVGLIEGVLPISFALDNEDEIEEEKRILYVALTRAKKRLFLTLHHEGRRSGITQFNKLSRFLSPLSVRECLDIREETGMNTSEDYYQDVYTGKVNEELLKRVINAYR